MITNSQQAARTFLVVGAVGLVLAGAGIGCVRRTLTINTDPQGALVYLNDAEVGRTPVSVDFLWYGDYDVIVRKEGYATLQTDERINEPWYQVPPFDFFAEVLWPGRIHDQRSVSYVLEPAVAPDREELLQRAEALRDETLYEAD
ncbi:MAG: PEGA domain-containing protein [Phycisphaerae bacterium]|nr:PEGA domain-containing protein [Phycisphaerae bacterium]